MTAFFFAAGGQNVLKEVVNLNDNVTSTCRWVGHPWNIASICQDPRSSQAWWTQNYTLRFKQLDNLLSAHWLSLKVTAFNNLLPLWMTGFSKGWSDCFHWSNDHSFCSQADMSMKPSGELLETPFERVLVGWTRGVFKDCS